ncbi:hypothetical protein E05_04520 [Plautia stali symbiont]|nr:hypothetical protein E05_04520 [Plautia stali symbiont]
MSQKKVLSLPLIIFGVSIIVFIAICALPGDPARLMAGPEASQEAVDSMRVRLGLDQPLPLQYVRFAGEALHGNLGLSLQSQRPVMNKISERLPYTLSLAALAYLLAIAIGVPAGMTGAIYRQRIPDQIVMVLTIAGASIANFWLALLAMNYFAVQLGWLPLLGADSWRNYLIDADRDAGDSPDGDDRADDALQHAGCAQSGLHPYRQSQRVIVGQR